MELPACACHAAGPPRQFHLQETPAIFGVGPYSFAPWKVAISGFYKKLQFVKIGCHFDKPIVLDDTCYFLSCGDEEEASQMTRWPNSAAVAELFSAHIFWDKKRPITAETLSLLDLDKVAADCQG